MRRCKQHVCEECGNTFEFDIHFRKYCNNECSKKVIAKKNRVRVREYGRRRYGSYKKWIKNLREAGYYVIHRDEFDSVLQTSIQIMKGNIER